MKHKISISRILILAFSLFIVILFFLYKLMDIQIVNQEAYLANVTSDIYRDVEQKALRGEILDVNGEKLVKNRIAYDVALDKVYIPDSEQNQLILNLTTLLKAKNIQWKDNMPISKSSPFVFTEDDGTGKIDRQVNLLIDNAELNVFSTAENVISKLIEIYNIDEDMYTIEEIRTIAGVRYQMVQDAYNTSTPFVIAEDVPFNVVLTIKESLHLSGVFIIESSRREYLSGINAPHVIGQMSSIFPEEIKEYIADGYSRTDRIGRSGIEKSQEEYLRGENGIRRDFLDQSGKIIDSNNFETIKETVPGNTIKLTIDMKLQEAVYLDMKRQVHKLRTSPNVRPGEGKEANAATVVVLDVPTGKVNAAVNFPSYNITDYNSILANITDDEPSPLFDRAFQGMYAPGSCFKPVTALASLNEGIITPTSTLFCGHVFHYFDYSPTCLGSHGNIPVTTALEKSCNIFFYQNGIALGYEKLNSYAKMLGLGEPTGIEVLEKIGHTANPESKEARTGEEWQSGDVLQAAIGQSTNWFSPLQLANYTATIARDGVLLETHLIDQVISYNGDNIIKDYEIKEISKMDLTEEAIRTVQQGMIQASSMSGTSWMVFGNYDIPVASKTGTPQTSEEANSVYIAYAPADNPKIAVLVIIEKGWHGYTGAPIAKTVFDYYFHPENVDMTPVPDIDFSAPIDEEVVVAVIPNP